MAAATVGRAPTDHDTKQRMAGMSRQHKGNLQRALNVLGPFIGLIFVIAIFAFIPEVQDRFLRIGNLKSVATQSVIVARARWA